MSDRRYPDLTKDQVLEAIYDVQKSIDFKVLEVHSIILQPPYYELVKDDIKNDNKLRTPYGSVHVFRVSQRGK